SAASNSCVVGTTANPSEMAGSPHVTGVGGTTFNPQYDSSGNDTSVVGVAPGGIETAWGSSGGGASNIFPKPTWQSGTGVPNDSKRHGDYPVLLGRHQPCGTAVGGIFPRDRPAKR